MTPFCAWLPRMPGLVRGSQAQRGTAFDVFGSQLLNARSRICWVVQAMPAMSAVWSGAWGMGHGVLVQPLTNKMPPNQNTPRLSTPDANAPNVGYEVLSPCVAAAI